jgi:DNA repair protein RadA/Sms
MRGAPDALGQGRRLRARAGGPRDQGRPLAGPRVLEHMVDTVLYFEGDTHSSFRLIRAIKNRFGAVNEIGVFAMTEQGLKGVSNPSAIFLSQHASRCPAAACW